LKLKKYIQKLGNPTSPSSPAITLKLTAGFETNLKPATHFEIGRSLKLNSVFEIALKLKVVYVYLH
jgi:hypothetical protein